MLKLTSIGTRNRVETRHGVVQTDFSLSRQKFHVEAASRPVIL